jgi:hypothetical protein
MPKGTQGEMIPPGINEKRYLAGVLEITTGTITRGFSTSDGANRSRGRARGALKCAEV